MESFQFFVSTVLTKPYHINLLLPLYTPVIQQVTNRLVMIIVARKQHETGVSLPPESLIKLQENRNRVTFPIFILQHLKKAEENALLLVSAKVAGNDKKQL